MLIELAPDSLEPQWLEPGLAAGLLERGAGGRLSLDTSGFERLGHSPLKGLSSEALGLDMLRRCCQLALDQIVEHLLQQRGASGWRTRLETPWRHMTPPGYVPREQGWKLHVSATPLSAPVVLERCAAVLIDSGCSFKFASALEHVEMLTSTRCERSQGGKFVTVYPRDDDTMRELAARLHAATLGLSGPGILSDRRYQPDSLVHYRFGAFNGVRTLTADGVYENRLRTPDGTLVRDLRQAWFSPPAWATLPFDEPGTPLPVTPQAVLLGDRFIVRGAIRHSNRGGVYRATDQTSGAEVIIKQARPHTGAELTGEDSRDALRHEAKMLEVLEGLGPQPLALFEQSGDLFLAETLIPGKPLRDWVSERLFTQPGEVAALELGAAMELAHGLTGLLSAVHERGLVCRDFTPNNIMVTPDLQLRLIDPELIARPGARVYRYYTPGFGAPELARTSKVDSCPGQEVDLYSLGATLFHLALGTSPLLLPDEPQDRTASDRLALLLSHAASANPVARRLAPAILGLMAHEPERRWGLARVREFLTAAAPEGELAVRSSRSLHEAERLLHDGLDHLVSAMARDEADRLWESNTFGATTDACNVQHGAAGVLAVLSRASGALDRPDLLPIIERTARWIDRRMATRAHHPPGLYFGSAGAAWALHDAAVRLGNGELRERALGYALALPMRWPNPDVCHGSAGAGLTMLHLWQATGDPRLLARVHECADGLLAAAVRTGGQLTWPIATDFDSKLAGLVHYGFAHGIAGVATFLLAAGAATGREDCLEAAKAAGDTLVAAADRSLEGARWQSAVGGAPTRSELYYYWCSGSSGVGTFLLRLWEATGRPEYRELAEAAALAVRRTRWLATTAACHGLAGNGEFLLDLADAVGGPYRSWAEEHADCLYARHALHHGRLVVPDESGQSVVADFNTGLAGVLGFLLRLRSGGPRWWLPQKRS